MAYAMRNSRIDGQLGNVAQYPEVIVAVAVFWQFPAGDFHGMGCLHNAQPVFSDASHRLRVARKHRDYAHVMQHVFRRDSFRTDAAFSEGDVRSHVWVQVVTHHDHVEQFSLGVDAEWKGWVSGAGQHV